MAGGVFRSSGGTLQRYKPSRRHMSIRCVRSACRRGNGQRCMRRINQRRRRLPEPNRGWWQPWAGSKRTVRGNCANAKKRLGARARVAKTEIEELVSCKSKFPAASRREIASTRRDGIASCLKLARRNAGGGKRCACAVGWCSAACRQIHGRQPAERSDTADRRVRTFKQTCSRRGEKSAEEPGDKYLIIEQFHQQLKDMDECYQDDDHSVKKEPRAIHPSAPEWQASQLAAQKWCCYPGPRGWWQSRPETLVRPETSSVCWDCMSFRREGQDRASASAGIPPAASPKRESWGGSDMPDGSHPWLGMVQNIVTT